MLATITLRKPSDATTVARMILDSDPEARIFTFTGDLGAGKTTLVKGFCEALGVKEGTSSPSFSIVNEYRTMTDQQIYHFDLYRLKKERELEDIGFNEYLDNGAFCFIEWPELAEGLLPVEIVRLNLRIGPGQHRTVRIEAA
ncbi:MAG: tRNA (adenosine(37)-N6)-threonylcarbamoyltransferase complex ATPase subunit type 1 TsaE [Bacteroidota bacterium]|nr:tRNA (adenosine(37)-N6)-threonylcarbamoyltransferase complex ATPase subunit type 1 TsaE [Bacteroidota bacterium]